MSRDQFRVLNYHWLASIGIHPRWYNPLGTAEGRRVTRRLALAGLLEWTQSVYDRQEVYRINEYGAAVVHRGPGYAKGISLPKEA